MAPGPMKLLAELPKAHLHLHLEAAMRPTTLHDLAAEHGIPLPPLSGFTTFAEFLRVYEAATESLREPEDVQRLFREAAEDARADGVVWMELHVYPPLWFGRFGDDEATLDLMLDAAASAATTTGVGIGLVVAADRTDGPEQAERMARLAASRAGQGVTTFGLANDEAGRPPELFVEAFRIARDAGLVCAPHAGELAGPESVRGALDLLHADRIGHGVRAVEDADLVRRLADEGITCDVCPTSNLVLGLYASLEEHAIGPLLDAGVPVSLNTDDPLLFGAGLLDEYEGVRDAFALDDAAVAGIARASIRASAAPDALKQRAEAGIDSWLSGTKP